MVARASPGNQDEKVQDNIVTTETRDGIQHDVQQQGGETYDAVMAAEHVQEVRLKVLGNEVGHHESAEQNLHRNVEEEHEKSETNDEVRPEGQHEIVDEDQVGHRVVVRGNDHDHDTEDADRGRNNGQGSPGGRDTAGAGRIAAPGDESHGGRWCWWQLLP